MHGVWLRRDRAAQGRFQRRVRHADHACRVAYRSPAASPPNAGTPRPRSRSSVPLSERGGTCIRTGRRAPAPLRRNPARPLAGPPAAPGGHSGCRGQRRVRRHRKLDQGVAGRATVPTATALAAQAQHLAVQRLRRDSYVQRPPVRSRANHSCRPSGMNETAVTAAAIQPGEMAAAGEFGGWCRRTVRQTAGATWRGVGRRSAYAREGGAVPLNDSC